MASPAKQMKTEGRDRGRLPPRTVTGQIMARSARLTVNGPVTGMQIVTKLRCHARTTHLTCSAHGGQALEDQIQCVVLLYLSGCLVLLLLLLLVSLAGLHYPTDCADLYASGVVSGVYTIYPDGNHSAVRVYCDMGSQNEEGEGGWTVFQRRMDGSVTFYRSWNQYKEGFGNVSGEYWLGLQVLHQLTTSKTCELKVDMEDFEGNRVFARYSNFSVASEEEGYKLTVSGFTDGGAGDSLSYHNGQHFSTYDTDHPGNCAQTYLGAHWYNNCHFSNPNGVYAHGPTTLFAIGVNWRSFREYHYSLKSFTMKIKPLA
ncbi:microfibril-associated glycoprotein 4-like [Sardina pilchardus]|uniref:microfibril-associated glycoprotein 4-like n=1 Tax=Sardina pilchardus TaxID=27697 RepID=UPI002E13F50B